MFLKSNFLLFFFFFFFFFFLSFSKFLTCAQNPRKRLGFDPNDFTLIQKDDFFKGLSWKKLSWMQNMSRLVQTSMMEIWITDKIQTNIKIQKKKKGKKEEKERKREEKKEGKRRGRNKYCITVICGEERRRKKNKSNFSGMKKKQETNSHWKHVWHIMLHTLDHRIFFIHSIIQSVCHSFSMQTRVCM